ncbi:MAG: sigma-54-dependent Fis family transcriptional regulator [Erythrobacter sp.]|nr:sigma-54-dependent Fis family transcriptional regulator [Erythrobacter sp.]
MTSQAPQVIFVEDDEALRTSAAQALELEGLAVAAFADAPAALRAIDADTPAVVVSDIRMPGMDGIAFFAALRAIDPQVPLLFTTAHGHVDLAVSLMKQGAVDFFTKPYSVAELARAVRQASEKRALVLENRKLRDELASRSATRRIGRSAAGERLHAVVEQVAATDADVVLFGAGGTGKSHLARAIHDASQRRNRPLVVVDPGVFATDEAALLLYGRDPGAALSRSGMVERAAGGTLVIEAIDQVPPRELARLASLAEQRVFLPLGADRPRAIDVRIIATCDVASEGASDGAGLDAFRRKLGGVSITLPRLAERREDIADFFRHFASRHERELGRTAGELDESELRHLLTHDWPGNLRELELFAYRFVLGLTRLAQAPAADQGNHASLRDLVGQFEKAVLEDALLRADGSVAEVQRALQVARKTLYDKLERYGLRPADFRRP